MQVYPAGVIVVLVWALCVLRGRGVAVALVGALFPFGMMNIFRLGGFSFVADDFVAVACTGLFGLYFLMTRPQIRLPGPGLLLVLMTVYAVFASVFLVRLFEGAVEVFAFNRLYDGVRISREFRGSLLPLGPSSANLSQTAYLVLDVCFFFVAFAAAHRVGPAPLIQGLRIGTAINITFGLLQLAGLGEVLSVIKTADYAVLDGHKVAGLPRLTGGFSEASAYGGVSAGLAGFFLVHGLFARRGADVALGALSAAMAVLALSSSGLVGVAVIAVFLLGCGVWRMQAALPAARLYRWTLLLLCLGLAGTLGLGTALLDVESLPYQVLDRLILSKGQSVSGLERGAMARNGLEVFWATWGMGAGIGSVMANGHLSAVLAAMGLPGLVLIAAFYGTSFFGVHGPLSVEQTAIRRAAQCFFLVALAIAMIGSFNAGPGLQRIYVAAIALAAVTSAQGLRPLRRPLPWRAGLRPGVVR